jgi:CRP-like cAMP-binding protein
MVLNPNNQFSLRDNERLLLFFKSIGKEVKVNKGSCLVKEGDRCNHFFFVLEGAFRAFRYVNDVEVIIGFSFAGDVDTCLYAYQNDINSLDTIEALTDSRVIKIEKSTFLTSLGDHAERQNLTAKLMSDYIEILIQRIIDYKTHTAEYNYLKLYNRQPDEVAKIPLMHIASYLGITPERLSRIRKKMKHSLT